MVVISVCVGSSCHLKGAPEIAKMIEDNVNKNNLQDDVAVIGSFCSGRCNRVGVTVTVGDDVYTGITRENFIEFWQNKVLPAIKADEN